MPEPQQYSRFKMSFRGKSMQLFLEEDPCMCARVYVRKKWTDLSGEPHSTAKKILQLRHCLCFIQHQHTLKQGERKIQKLRKHSKKYRQKKSHKSLHTSLSECTALNNLILKHSNSHMH